MQIVPQSKPSVLGAALVAPAVTPIIALVSLAWFPNMGTSGGYYFIAIPFVFVFALIYGYLGMLLVCLPFAAVLSRTRLLGAPALCSLTSITGAALWTWHDAHPMQPALDSFIVGFLCSLGVSALFCYLAGIAIRPGRSGFRGSTWFGR